MDALTNDHGPSTMQFRSAIPSLPVSDEGRAVAFYREALGLRELTRDGAGLGILVRDEVETHLWVADGSARVPSLILRVRPRAGSR